MHEITSRKNKLIVHLKKLGADGDYRREAGEFLCDGEKLLREAVVSGADIKAVLTSGEKPDGLPITIPVYHARQEIIDSVSPLKSPQTILFSCVMPVGPGNAPIEDKPILILEGVQDPGNVGTILRTASAFGIACVALTGGCADPYNPKTVRATMGAIFRQRIVLLDEGGVAALKSKGYRVYGAALGKDSRDIREVSLRNAAVAIGSEGHGLSDVLLALCDEKLVIPMAPDSESLNAAVAAGIVMWEMRKRN